MKKKLNPIPIKKVSGDTMMTDGHTTAVVAIERGMKEVEVYWDQDVLNWIVYEECLKWCKNEKIKSPYDLVNRVIENDEYEIKWLKRCQQILKSTKEGE